MRDLSSLNPSPFGVFTYHVMWECTFTSLHIRNRADLKAYISQFCSTFPSEPLRPRAALMGGRVNAIIHDVTVNLEVGDRLCYLDFVSLYPSVQFGVHGEVWPIGYPIIYLGSEVEEVGGAEEWFGLVDLTILPPRGLYHPVLGERVGEKLVFHLCHTCAEQGNESECLHSVNERVIKGTYFTGEIQLALSKGYQILAVHELWHWPSSQRSGDLFKGLIRDLYQKKQLASEPPSDQNEMKELLSECEDMGIHICENDFSPNKPLRQQAKLSLNSIWGFLAGEWT